MALLGPNGAGKSTLLRLAAGTVPAATGGHLQVLGHPPPLPPPFLRRIGYAPDRAPHFRPLSGRENALFFARAGGRGTDTKPEAAVEALFGRLGLLPVAERPVRTYSAGMEKKLLLVEAMAHEPDLLLLDEAFAALDPPSVAGVVDLLRERVEDGAGILLSSHALREVPGVADRVLLLHRGRIVADAPPRALLERYGGHPTVEVTLDRALPSSLSLPPGATHLSSRQGHEVFEVSRGAEAVPGLLRCLLDAGVEPRALRLLEPHLGHVFQRLTGEAIDEAGEGTPP